MRKFSDWLIAFVMLCGFFAGASAILAMIDYFFGSIVMFGTVLFGICAKWAWEIVSKEDAP